MPLNKRLRLNRDPLAIVSQSMFVRTVAATIFSLAITACVPWPHRDYFAPGRPSATAITDADGRFVLRPISEWRFIAPLIGDPLYGYTLEVDLGDRKFSVYSNGGVGYAESRLELRCDLSADLGAMKRPQICTAVWSHQ